MTTNQPNPEAVEAAARAIGYERWGPGEWVDDAMLLEARAALSAALPLLPDIGDLLAEMDRLRSAMAKPDREDIAAALHGDECAEDPDDGETCVCDGAHYRRLADVVLAVLPGRTEAQIRAEALREFASTLPGMARTDSAESWGLITARHAAEDRADRIERGEV